MIERNEDGTVKNSIRARANMTILETLWYFVLKQIPRAYVESFRDAKEAVPFLINLLLLPVLPIWSVAMAIYQREWYRRELARFERRRK
jgi:hypothetical protein